MNVKNDNNPRFTYFNVLKKKYHLYFFLSFFIKKVRFSNLLMEKIKVSFNISRSFQDNGAKMNVARGIMYFESPHTVVFVFVQRLSIGFPPPPLKIHWLARSE